MSDRPTRQRTGSIDDTLLEMVLSDLRVYEGSDRPMSLGPDIPREIYFSPVAMKWVPDPMEPLEHNGLWSKMVDSQRQLIQEAITHLEGRYASGDSFVGFCATSAAIHTVDKLSGIDSTAKDTPYAARFPIEAWAPGFSNDRTCVVVHLRFPELFHPSYATYVLMSTSGEWRIVFRGFVTYV